MLAPLRAGFIKHPPDTRSVNVRQAHNPHDHAQPSGGPSLLMQPCPPSGILAEHAATASSPNSTYGAMLAAATPPTPATPRAGQSPDYFAWDCMAPMHAGQHSAGPNDHALQLPCSSCQAQDGKGLGFGDPRWDSMASSPLACRQTLDGSAVAEVRAGRSDAGPPQPLPTAPRPPAPLPTPPGLPAPLLVPASPHTPSPLPAPALPHPAAPFPTPGLPCPPSAPLLCAHVPPPPRPTPGPPHPPPPLQHTLRNHLAASASTGITSAAARHAWWHVYVAARHGMQAGHHGATRGHQGECQVSVQDHLEPFLGPHLSIRCPRPRVHLPEP